ncbi:MAG TPA: GNAT family N-acetyltransferase [Mizugakiibacter sp.]
MFAGADVAPHLDAVAALRIAVFRDWPYLYDGDAAYEATYLATYARSPRSLFVLAFDGARVAGASTGIPLADETEAFQRPFRARGLPVGRVFYFGESVLLPAYRGRGIGHAFFDAREAFARTLGGFTLAAFCEVERDAADPRRPPGYRSNDAFWSRRGYVRQDDMCCELDWTEVGADAPAPHRLCYWLRPLEAAP